MKTEQTSNVSVIEAANDYKDYEAIYENSFNGFIAGANWQKEQDKAIIEELLEVIKMLQWAEENGESYAQRYGKPRLTERLEITKNIISKAEQYINQ